jgi:hypothetical protein
MSAVPLDTLSYARRLKEGGFTEQQAETLAVTQAELVGQGLATKADIAELRTATKADIAELRTTIHALGLDLRREMAELKADLIKWNVGAIIAMTGLFTAIVKLL